MKVRIKFTKKGSVKFIGHLDLLRYFQKAIRRSGIDAIYSGGYSPHQIMSFASPLGVGLESNGEYMDIEVNQFTSSSEMRDILQKTMAEGIEILSVRKLDDKTLNAMSSVSAADYTVRIREDYLENLDITEAINHFHSLEHIPITKESKKSTREIDLKPFIHILRAVDRRTVFMRLTAGSAENIKPELVMEAICSIGNNLDPGKDLFNRLALMITREEIYTCEAPMENNHTFIPLEDVGEVF